MEDDGGNGTRIVPEAEALGSSHAPHLHLVEVLRKAKQSIIGNTL